MTHKMEIYEEEMGYDREELMLDDALHLKDLINGGTSFSLNSNFQDQDEMDEMFPELYSGEDALELDFEDLMSPWQKPFCELIPNMTCIGYNIYKKIVKHPIDNKAIEGKCRVTITYSSYMENEVVGFDSTYMRDETKVFLTDNNEVLEGINLAVKSMKRGEESQFIIPYQLMFGDWGCPPRIKPKSDILCVIHLKNFTPTGDLNAIDKVDEKDSRKYEVMIKRILEVKANGTENFKERAWMKAASAFHKAINCLEICHLKNDDEAKEQRDHLIKLYTNLMLCYNKMDKPNRVCSAFQELSRLTDTSKIAKVLFNYGKAMMSLGEYIRAKGALTKAYQLKPNDIVIANQLKLLNERHSKHKEFESNMWRQAMGNTKSKVTKEYCGIEDNFKKNVEKILVDFKNNNKESNLTLPVAATPAEISAIEELAKDMEIKLVTSEIHGKKVFSLSKFKDIN